LRGTIVCKTLTTLVAAMAVAGFGPVPAALAAGGGTATGADLQVSGSASTGSPVAGTPFVYTFLVKNSGPSAASSTTFTDTLPAGTVVTHATAVYGGVARQCTSDGATAPTVSCDVGFVLKAGQGSVQLNVNAPTTPGTYASVGKVSSAVSDPNPSNNAATMSVKVKPLPTCALPAGQTTIHGIVMAKYTNANGLFENFLFQSDGVNYTVLTNFYDATRPLTSIINELCKPVTTVFVQGGNFVTVTGTVGNEVLPGATDPTPVIHASVIQVPFLFDMAA
jgi:uncharacterized repeat protein (TIGR01451 family)